MVQRSVCQQKATLIVFLLLVVVAFLRFLTSSMKRKKVSLVLKNLSMSSVSSIHVLPSMTKSNVSAQEVTID